MKDNLMHVPDGSPWWLYAAANLILFLHIAGGVVGILSGTVAMAVRKGLRVHRLAGNVFFASMLVMAGIGAAASPFLQVPEMANVFGGLMTFYLLGTGWMAVRRKGPGVGRFEIAGLAMALGLVAAGAEFIAIARHGPSPLLAQTPPQAFYVFVVIGTIGALGDVNLILRGGLIGPSRIARHLWRMSAALTIATGSFFLGQQKVMPVWMHGSPWLFVPALAPLFAMAYWLVRVRIGRRFRGAGVANVRSAVLS
ncbi:MAG TPA: hypothetical protein VK753_08120 [Xanthomonadaceae bacterium]|jgi:hypothetical protein|nr:hypothetical protein [Xanthomonadaceae bacterium]